MSKSQGWSWWAMEVEGPADKPDWYQVNENSRDEVIAAGRREYGPGAWLAIVEASCEGHFLARPFDEGGDCPLIERALEAFQENNAERWGEYGPEFGFDPGLLAKALNDAFETFIRDNHALVMEGAWAFTGQRNAEILPPVVEGARATT